MVLKKILIVDDEADVLSILEKRLAATGYQVIQAQTGREAINLAKTEQPSLILLDVNMPEMDGGKVKRILQEDPVTAKIPVMFLTCLITREDEKRAGHEIAGNFFIAKPYNSDELLRMIEEHIR